MNTQQLIQGLCLLFALLEQAVLIEELVSGVSRNVSNNRIQVFNLQNDVVNIFDGEQIVVVRADGSSSSRDSTWLLRFVLHLFGVTRFFLFELQDGARSANRVSRDTAQHSLEVDGSLLGRCASKSLAYGAMIDQLSCRGIWSKLKSDS